MLRQSPSAARLTNSELREQAGRKYLLRKKVSPAQGRLPIPEIYQFFMFADPGNIHLDFTKPVACSINK